MKIKKDSTFKYWGIKTYSFYLPQKENYKKRKTIKIFLDRVSKIISLNCFMHCRKCRIFYLVGVCRECKAINCLRCVVLQSISKLRAVCMYIWSYRHKYWNPSMEIPTDIKFKKQNDRSDLENLFWR